MTIRDANRPDGMHRGGLLTGAEILRCIANDKIEIEPFDESRLGPNSFDVTLGDKLSIYVDAMDRVILPDMLAAQVSGSLSCFAAEGPLNEDLEAVAGLKTFEETYQELSDWFEGRGLVMDASGKSKNGPRLKELTIPEEGLVLMPGIPYLGSTVERVFSRSYVPIMEGRSTCGRLFLSPYHSAGFGDLGFNGTWTLEITSLFPVRVFPGQRIAQLGFWTVEGDRDVQYDTRSNSKYNGQSDPTPWRADVDFAGQEEE